MSTSQEYALFENNNSEYITEQLLNQNFMIDETILRSLRYRYIVCINTTEDTIFVDFELPRHEASTSECYQKPLYLLLDFRVSYTNSNRVPKVEVSHNKRQDLDKSKKCAKTYQLEKAVESLLDSYWRNKHSNSSVIEPPSTPPKPLSTSNPVLEKLVMMGFDRMLAKAALNYADTVETATQFLLTPECSSLVFENMSFDEVIEPAFTYITDKGLLVYIFEYALQRLKTLNDYCFSCDEYLQNKKDQKTPKICDKEMCEFFLQDFSRSPTFQPVQQPYVPTFDSNSDIAELLISMALAAANHPRWEDVFDPFPLILDENHSTVLSPHNKDRKLVTHLLNLVLQNITSTQEDFQQSDVLMDRHDQHVLSLFNWIITTNQSQIIRLPEFQQITELATPYQYFFLTTVPDRELRFQIQKDQYGSVFAFHGSPIENWHSIFHLGLRVMSHTKFQLNGAAHGRGIYLSPKAAVSLGYMGNRRFAPSRVQDLSNKQQTSCLALCEVVNKDIKKHGNIWVVADEDDVIVRFIFVYKSKPASSASVLDCENRDFSERIHSLLHMPDAELVPMCNPALTCN